MSAKDLILSKKAQVEAEVASYDAILSALEVDLKAAEDRGFDLGVAQAGIEGEKIYTEEDLQNELNPLKSKIEALELQVAQLEVTKEQKLQEFKQSLIEKYEAQQASESQGEQDILSFLKS